MHQRFGQDKIGKPGKPVRIALEGNRVRKNSRRIAPQVLPHSVLRPRPDVGRRRPAAPLAP